MTVVKTPSLSHTTNRFVYISVLGKKNRPKSKSFVTLQTRFPSCRTTFSQAEWLFRQVDIYSVGRITVLQADCLFLAAWMAFSPRLIGPTIFILIPPDKYVTLESLPIITKFLKRFVLEILNKYLVMRIS